MELTLTMAQAMAQAMVARAIEEATSRFGRPICVAVCDQYGFLLAFGRMDGAPVRSIQIAQCKAYTAARIGIGTTAFHERLQGQGYPASYFCDPGLTGLPGGAVLRGVGDSVAGGVGISGLLPAEDQVIADLVAGPA